MKEEDPDWLMGFQLINDACKCTVAICHKQYISTILKQYRMDECNPTYLPMGPKVTLSREDSPQSEEEKCEMARIPYRELVGALM